VQIGYAELKVRAIRGHSSVPIQRLTLLFDVVHVVVSSFFFEPRETSIRADWLRRAKG